MASEYREKGFTNAKTLDGGLEGWKQAGYPFNDMTSISAEFPFESKFTEIKGSKMHYMEQGGDRHFSSFTAIPPHHISGEI